MMKEGFRLGAIVRARRPRGAGAVVGAIAAGEEKDVQRTVCPA